MSDRSKTDRRNPNVVTNPYERWADFKMPNVKDLDDDYGVPWPEGTTQIIKELAAFRMGRERRPLPGAKSIFTHFLRIIQILFPDTVHFYKDVISVKGDPDCIYLESGRIWNNYCLDIAYKLCKSKKRKRLLAGPASANKTYLVALYGYICYISNPKETMVMLSTTSVGGAERRIWGCVKDFHKTAKFEEAGIEPPGQVIEYLKCITFDEQKQIGGAEFNNRDFRSGIIVIPIATDSTGDTALSAIQGTKNRHALWIIDEMAQMRDGVTRVARNLMANPFFEMIGIGNSSSESDPHGEECMPMGGLDSISYDSDRTWIAAKGGDVLFLHGDDSPNNHPLIDQSKVTGPSDYPYDYATNPWNNNEIAIDCGNGNVEVGKMTLDYWKFAIGYWAPKDASSSLFSNNLAKSNNATADPELLVNSIQSFGGGDFAFSAGGDDNTFFSLKFGYTAQGRKQVHLMREAKSIKITANEKSEFNKATAAGFIMAIREHNIQFNDFGADTGNDAAITLNEMSRLAGTHDFVGISSIGEANNKAKYRNKVTELHFQVRDLIRTGLFRGLHTGSKFWTQLCQRRYTSLSKGVYQIEPKKEMKKRIGRSPDDADAFIYACHMLIRSGLVSDELAKARTIDVSDVDHTGTNTNYFTERDEWGFPITGERLERQLTERRSESEEIMSYDDEYGSDTSDDYCSIF